MLNLDSPPTTIFEYERQMRINEDIIRFLTIKIEEIDSKPSVLSTENEKSPSHKLEALNRRREKRSYGRPISILALRFLDLSKNSINLLKQYFKTAQHILLRCFCHLLSTFQIARVNIIDAGCLHLLQL